MALPTYIPPATTIQQEFAPLATAVILPQNACLIGPNKQVLQYGDPLDRSNVSYGAYAPSGDTIGDGGTEGTVYPYNALPVGGIVEQNSLELYFEQVLAQYASIAVTLGTVPNQVVIGEGATGFQAFGTFPRNSAFMNRDVQVGDRVSLTASGHTLNTTVAGFINSIVAATVADPVAGESNPDTNELVTGGAYTGAYSTVYQLTVVKGGAWANNPQVMVTTSTGIDSAAPIAVASASTGNISFPLGNYGLTARFSNSVISGITVNDSPTVTIATAGLTAGMTVTGAGVPGGTTILAVGATTITLSAHATEGATVSLSFGGLILGDTFSVAVTAASAGAANIMILADPVPSAVASVAGTALAATFSIFKPSIAIPAKGYPSFYSTALTAGPAHFTVAAGVQIIDPTWTEIDGVTPAPLTVQSANVFVGYTALVTSSANILQSLSNISSVPAILGKQIPQNPLAYAVYLALLNSGGQPVYFLPVATNDLAGYTTALAALESSSISVPYFYIPLSEDPAITTLVNGQVTANSGATPANWCYGLAASCVKSTLPLYTTKADGDNWTGSVSIAASSSPAQYTQLAMPGATFIDGSVGPSVRPGDQVLTNFSVDAYGNPTYSTALVQSVTDQQDLVLVSPGLAAPVVGQQIQIIRLLTNDEYALAVANTSAAFNSRRFSNVYPNFPLSVARYFVAAAVAGLASSVAPHQPITNYAIQGFAGMTGPVKGLTQTQLNTIASGGTLIVNQDAASGVIYVRHQLTTDYTSDALHWEMSITRNYDSISLYFYQLINPFTGKYNLVTNFLLLVKAMMINGFNYLSGTATSTPSAGPQVADWDSTSLVIAQNPTSKTQLNIAASFDMGMPGNNFNLALTANG